MQPPHFLAELFIDNIKGLHVPISPQKNNTPQNPITQTSPAKNNGAEIQFRCGEKKTDDNANFYDGRKQINNVDYIRGAFKNTCFEAAVLFSK